MLQIRRKNFNVINNELQLLAIIKTQDILRKVSLINLMQKYTASSRRENSNTQRPVKMAWNILLQVGSKSSKMKDLVKIAHILGPDKNDHHQSSQRAVAYTSVEL